MHNAVQPHARIKTSYPCAHAAPHPAPRPAPQHALDRAVVHLQQQAAELTGTTVRPDDAIGNPQRLPLPRLLALAATLMGGAPEDRLAAFAAAHTAVSRGTLPDKAALRKAVPSSNAAVPDYTMTRPELESLVDAGFSTWQTPAQQRPRAEREYPMPEYRACTAQEALTEALQQLNMPADKAEFQAPDVEAVMFSRAVCLWGQCYA